jgi:D-glycero-D-manno-heptose 1,7-bisphosphate phosphatase
MGDAPVGSGSLKPALFLDRDGVINVDHGYVHLPDDTEWIPGVFELVSSARRAGYVPVVVTNQAGIARGIYSEEDFRDYTRWVHSVFLANNAPLAATYYCPHHPSAGKGPYMLRCDCRKPAPGMLLAAAKDLGLDLAKSALLGDKDSDLEAARAAGVPTRFKIAHGGAAFFEVLPFLQRPMK